MIFKPRRSTGVLVGIAIIVSLLGLDALLLLYLRRSQLNLLSFAFALLVILSLPLLALLGYLVYALLTLRYHLHRDALTIVWGGIQHIIPTSSIQRVLRGKDLQADFKVKGIRWPGYLVGGTWIEGIGRILFYATEPIARQLLVVTSTTAYGISPADLDGFLDAFEIRQHMGPIRLLSYEHRQPRFLSWPIWRDRVAHVLLTLGLGVNLLFFAYLCWIYPALGQTDILKLPAIGLITLAINSSLGALIHNRQRVGGYLLWGGAIVVQLLCWLAALNIVG